MTNDPREMFRLCLEQAWGSPDPSTQNGAIIVSQQGQVLGQGCNEFPRGVEVTSERLQRPLKYQFIEHAERNAIFNAGVLHPTDEMWALWAACTDCASAIIQSGLRTVHTHSFYLGDEAPDEARKNWTGDIAVAFTMFEEAGVEVVYHDVEVMKPGETLLYNGEPVRY